MNRRRLFSLLLAGSVAVALCLPVLSAGASTPLIRTHLASKVAVPGQIITLEVTILVPTWMPSPPEFPNFELPDASVRLPEGASRPAMERIGQESWSGVTREYQISPMVVGRFTIPPQTIRVTYADPETRAPLEVALRTKAIVFEGRAPVGAEELDPFIAAVELTLDQTLDADPTDLEPGDAFTRTVTAQVIGASPIFLPRLVSVLKADGLAAYPKEPSFRESSNRGRTTGERIESVTYVAEAGGRFSAAPIRLRWWNLRTKQIEVAELPALEIVSRGPPLLRRSANEPSVPVPAIAGGILVAGLLGGLTRYFWPHLLSARRRRREARRSSEAFAFKEVTEAIRTERFGDVARAVERWLVRLNASEAERARLFRHLEPLSATLYGAGHHTVSKQQWSRSSRAIRDARREFHAIERVEAGRRALPPLNPDPWAGSLHKV